VTILPARYPLRLVDPRLQKVAPAKPGKDADDKLAWRLEVQAAAHAEREPGYVPPPCIPECGCQRPLSGEGPVEA
jgi:hypothetical protein